MDRTIASVAVWPVFIVHLKNFLEQFDPLQSGSGCGTDTITLFSSLV